MNVNTNKRNVNVFVLFITAALFLVSCRNGEKPIKLIGEAQGTTYTITYYDSLQRNLQQEIDSLLHQFDLTASLWVDSSLIRLVNDNSDSVVNGWFADLVAMSAEMNGYTDGCFDCTIGRLVNVWGFGFSKREEVDDHTIDSLLQFSGTQPIIVLNSENKPVVRKAHPETALDFNAIAQGYSTDLVCRFLNQQGIGNYLVDIGGEVYAKGRKPDGTAWTVGIERPAENKYSTPEIETAITLENKSVVTSGSYRKYYEKDGLRYSHTIDPKTGHPVEHTLLSVSVVDSAAWRADALATAFMVMGLQQSLSFIENHKNDPGAQTAFFIYSDNEGYKTYATERFKELIKQK